MMRRVPRVASMGLLAASLGAVSASAQLRTDDVLLIQLGVRPDTVTVGEPFESALRIATPPGVRIKYGDLTGSDSLQATAPVTLSPTADGDTAAVYSLVAWIAGQPLETTVPIRFTLPDGTIREHAVRLQLPTVRSVFPAGDTVVEPQPAKGLIVPSVPGERSWLWIVLLLAALALGMLGYWLRDRRHRAEEEPMAVDPRAWALGQLDAIALGDLSNGEALAVLYRRVSSILRGYLFRVDATWSLDLTTTELTETLPYRDGEEEVRRGLERLLRAADRVKFAAYRPTAEDARDLLRDTRSWIGSYPPTADESGEPRRAA